MSDLQQYLDAAIEKGGRINQLNDQAVVETIIRNYFRSIRPLGQRHLVDVGAAYGSVAGVFLNDGWSADLFEPDPSCRKHLNKLLAKHGARVRLFAHAVSGENHDSMTFHQNAIAGLSGLSRSPFGTAHAELLVRTVRLDTFLPSVDVTSVDLLKIDTEGNDFDVMESLDFSAIAPAIVFIEYSYYFEKQNPQNLAEAITRMRKRGYHAVVFEYCDDGNFRRNNWDHRLVATHLDDGRLPIAANAFGNVLFYRGGDNVLTNVLMATAQALN